MLKTQDLVFYQQDTWRKSKLQNCYFLLLDLAIWIEKVSKCQHPKILESFGYLWTQNLRRSNYYKTFKFQTSDDKPCMPQSWLTEILALKKKKSGGLTRSSRRCNWFFWIQSSYQVAPSCHLIKYQNIFPRILMTSHIFEELYSNY